MNRPPPITVSPHLRWCCVALFVAVVYALVMFYGFYGSVSVALPALVLVVGGPLLVKLVAPAGQWHRRTVVALFVLGSVATLVGIIGSGAVSTAGAPVNPSQYHWGYEYNWAANTLHFGLTRDGTMYPSSVRPNRGSLLLGIATTTLGVYGRMPPAWLHE